MHACIMEERHYRIPTCAGTRGTVCSVYRSCTPPGFGRQEQAPAVAVAVGIYLFISVTFRLRFRLDGWMRGGWGGGGGGAMQVS